MKEINEEEKSFEQINIFIIGNNGVGKSSLIKRFAKKDKYPGKYLSELAKDKGIKYLEKGGNFYKLHFFEISSIVDYENNLNPDGIFFIYDTTNQQSFDDISNFIEYFQDKTGKNIPMILIGSKKDLSDKTIIWPSEGEGLAKNKELEFFEMNIIEGTNINTALNSLVETIIKKRTEVNSNIEKQKKKKKKMSQMMRIIRIIHGFALAVNNLWKISLIEI